MDPISSAREDAHEAGPLESHPFIHPSIHSTTIYLPCAYHAPDMAQALDTAGTHMKPLLHELTL